MCPFLWFIEFYLYFTLAPSSPFHFFPAPSSPLLLPPLPSLSPSPPQPDHQISDYTYERTLIMEQRTEMLRQMKLTNRDRAKEVSLCIQRQQRCSNEVFESLKPHYHMKCLVYRLLVLHATSFVGPVHFGSPPCLA